MATITFNKEYNFWDILVLAGVQPREVERYEYTESDELATLELADVTQQVLDAALSSYNHEQFLNGLTNQQPTELERLSEQVATQNQAIAELTMIIAGGV